MQASEWLVQAEAAVSRAANTLRDSEAELEAAATYLRRAPAGTPLEAAALQRLGELRRKLSNLQAQARYGAALHTGLDQLDQTSVIGYNRTGLERAL